MKKIPNENMISRNNDGIRMAKATAQCRSAFARTFEGDENNTKRKHDQFEGDEKMKKNLAESRPAKTLRQHE